MLSGGLCLMSVVGGLVGIHTGLELHALSAAGLLAVAYSSRGLAGVWLGGLGWIGDDSPG